MIDDDHEYCPVCEKHSTKCWCFVDDPPDLEFENPCQGPHLRSAIPQPVSDPKMRRRWRLVRHAPSRYTFLIGWSWSFSADAFLIHLGWWELMTWKADDAPET